MDFTRPEDPCLLVRKLHSDFYKLVISIKPHNKIKYLLQNQYDMMPAIVLL